MENIYTILKQCFYMLCEIRSKCFKKHCNAVYDSTVYNDNFYKIDIDVCILGNQFDIIFKSLATSIKEVRYIYGPNKINKCKIICDQNLIKDISYTATYIGNNTYKLNTNK